MTVRRASLFGNIGEVLSALARRVFVIPARRKEWEEKSEPLVYQTEHGIHFVLDPKEFIDGQIFIHGLYERGVLNHLLRFSGETMLDIGANIGNHALYLAPYFNAVHCFEPNPPVVEKLRRNADINQPKNLTIHPVGLGETDDSLPFYDCKPGNIGAGSFARRKGAATRTLEVKNGDDYLASQRITGVDLIKLDVEGYESQVLRGLSKTIARDKPVIAFEFDGTSEQFGAIRASLPGYAIYELVTFSSAPSLRRAMRSGLAMEERALPEPENRYYEALLARPLG